MSLRSLLRSVVQWIRSPRRVEPELRITPEQLRAALSEMLADPETRKLLVTSLAGMIFPISGGQTCTAASFTKAGSVAEGTFGGSCSGTRNFTFEAEAAGTIPLTVKGASGQSVDLQQWKKSDDTVLAVVDKDGRVGIGPMAPLVKLSLGTDITAQKLALYDGVGDFYGLGVQGGRIVIHTQNTEKMTILNNGNVGIGTTTPNVKLSLGTDITAQKLALYDGVGDFYGLGVQGSRIVIHTSSTERMTIMGGSGNVGIGATDRLSRLTVKGRASFSAQGTVSVSLATPTTVTGTNTKFTQDVGLGDRITIETETRTVVTIANDTSLTVDKPFSSAHSNQAMTVLPSIFHAEDSSGAAKVAISDQGVLLLGPGGPSGPKQINFGPEMINASFATRRVVLWAGAAADVEAMFLINSNGMLEWGPGGSADQEFRFERTASHQLTLFDALFGIALPNDPQPRVALKNGTMPDAGQVHFGDGSVLDVILSRFFVSAALKGLKLAGGDFYVSDAGKGIILKNAAGDKCTRVRLNDAGTGLIFDLLGACP